MNIVVAHNPVGEHAPEDERDVLVQAEEVSGALDLLGFHPECVPFELSGDTFAKHIREINPACIFNLVESVDGDARLIHIAPSYFDHLGIPYTGASAQAMFLTSNKVLSKKFMSLNHIATPQWYVPGHTPLTRLVFPDTYIIKALWEEASVGIDDESVVTVSNREELEHLIHKRCIQLGVECFAEQYIEGREFNISLLAREGNVEVLPAAEIRFNLPQARHNILDYRAKWDQDSAEYKGTVRSFDFSKEDSILIETLNSIALKCWESFELTGYNRVDFRVDASGSSFVLEINANPCISPDSGFVAAGQRAGLSYPMIIERILLDAIPGRYTQYKKAMCR
jgi:D-alanine-D-alanine ligase